MANEAIRVSVAMAVRNGERYLREQVDSILRQLEEEDELVISYDNSTDGTKWIIDTYAALDPRVRVIKNRGAPGVANNFNNAIIACRGMYIFLSDQDDVWMDEKVAVVLDVFDKTGADLVVHDGYVTNAALQIQPGTLFERTGTYNVPLRNLIRCSFWGCCMAFRTSLRPLLCPIPGNGRIPHDHWISMLAGIRGKVVRCNRILIEHRIHENNASARHRRDLWTILKCRLILAAALVKRLRERKKAPDIQQTCTIRDGAEASTGSRGS